MRFLLAFFLSLIYLSPISAGHCTDDFPQDCWYCPLHKKQFDSLGAYNKHIRKHHQDKAAEEKNRVTIYDGKEMWELTSNGLKKMELTPQQIDDCEKKADAIYKCPYCSRKFYTYSACYWHKKNAHPGEIYK